MLSISSSYTVRVCVLICTLALAGFLVWFAVRVSVGPVFEQPDEWSMLLIQPEPEPTLTSTWPE